MEGISGTGAKGCTTTHGLEGTLAFQFIAAGHSDFPFPCAQAIVTPVLSIHITIYKGMRDRTETGDNWFRNPEFYEVGGCYKFLKTG